MTRRQKRPTPTNPSHDLRQRILEYFQTLRIPMAEDELDAMLAEAEKQQWNSLELLSHVLGPQADLRRRRAVDRRIREARFREPVTLEGFDWDFNAPTIDRKVIETLGHWQVHSPRRQPRHRGPKRRGQEPDYSIGGKGCLRPRIADLLNEVH